MRTGLRLGGWPKGGGGLPFLIGLPHYRNNDLKNMYGFGGWRVEDLEK